MSSNADEILNRLIEDDLIDWDQIQNEIFSWPEDFIKKYHQNFDWGIVSSYILMDEDLITRFRDYVNWEYISSHQGSLRPNHFSQDFLRRHIDDIDWGELPADQPIDDDIETEAILKGYLDPEERRAPSYQEPYHVVELRRKVIDMMRRGEM